MAEQIDVPLKVVDFTEEHFKMVKNPKYGYGKNMNPCVDCHAMMMRYAGKILKELEADFIITGEVLNQRPMSQNYKALDIVKKESGFEEYILRPLCAKNLKPTKMELEGLVDREMLLDIAGRSRKPQMKLAEEWGIVDYPSPAGGCRLTEPNFSMRLEDLLDTDPECKPEDTFLLRHGRHFRINKNVKVISSRDELDFKAIEPYLKKGYLIFDTVDFPGSTIILIGNPDENDIKLAASICGRYGKGKDEKEVNVRYKRLEDEEYKTIRVAPITDEDIRKFILE
jgi:hypothetical protein